MNFVFDNERPIYVQLVEQLKLIIITGELKSGERLPSVRELAMMTRVNPNTMQKALQELEKDGLIYTERTNGKYVTEDTLLISKIKEDLAREKTQKYMEEMRNLSLSINEIKKIIEEEKDWKS